MDNQGVVFGQDSNDGSLRELQGEIVDDIQGGLVAQLVIDQDHTRFGGAQLAEEALHRRENINELELLLRAEGRCHLLLHRAGVTDKNHADGFIRVCHTHSLR